MRRVVSAPAGCAAASPVPLATVALVAAAVGLAACTSGSAGDGGDAPGATAADPAPPSASGSGGPGATPADGGSAAGDGSVGPQPEPLPPSPAGTGVGGGVSGVLRAIRAAGLLAARPREDDCRALPPGMADGCVEILRTDTVTVWRFETDAAARRYVSKVTGTAGGMARRGYVVELPAGSASGLRDRYGKALESVG
jgi:hypothetical protein